MNNIIIFIISLFIGIVTGYFIRMYTIKFNKFNKTNNKKFDSYIYKLPEGCPKTCIENGFNKQAEIGKITDLIINMISKHADNDEMVNVIEHSEVIIDAEKYNLDWKKSMKDHNIEELKNKYMNKY